LAHVLLLLLLLLLRVLVLDGAALPNTEASVGDSAGGDATAMGRLLRVS
jgi:hypothetical protein